MVQVLIGGQVIAIIVSRLPAPKQREPGTNTCTSPLGHTHYKHTHHHQATPTTSTHITTRPHPLQAHTSPPGHTHYKHTHHHQATPTTSTHITTRPHPLLAHTSPPGHTHYKHSGFDSIEVIVVKTFNPN